LVTDGRARIKQMIAVDCGKTDFEDFKKFQSEGQDLLNKMQDKNFCYDENPELAGIVTWLISMGCK